MDSHTNIDANSLFATGLDLNSHPLLASTSIFSITSATTPSSLYNPTDAIGVNYAPLSITADSTITGIPVIQLSGLQTNPTNLFATPLSTTLTRDSLFAPAGNPTSLNGYDALLNPRVSTLFLGTDVAVSQIQAFLNRPDRLEQFKIAFGQDLDRAIIDRIVENWQEQGSKLPNIEVVSAQILGKADGGFDGANNKIYLSSNLIERGNLSEIVPVIIEEIGHYLDTKIHPNSDASGDEGEIFSRLVRGVDISAAEYVTLIREDDSTTIILNNNPVQIEQSVTTAYAIKAEKTVSFNGNLDLDGNPLDLSDDALVYGGTGFSLKGNSILPVKYDASGNPIKDSQGKLVLVDKAVTVAAGYLQANVNGNASNKYAGLTPPQIVAAETVTVPLFADLKLQELNRKIPAGTPTTIFNISTNPINNATQWATKFPPAGTATVPTVVRVTGGGLNIPGTVNLSNYVIIVDSGDINFNGTGNLSNVTLVASNGNINLNSIQADNLSVLASGTINENSSARFGGDILFANGSGNITFNAATKGTTTNDNLRVISAGGITFNGAQSTRGSFISQGDFTANGSTTIYGTVSSKQNITFNGALTLIYANIRDYSDSNPPVILAGLVNDSGISNSDKITNDGRISGTVTDASQIVAFKAGFDSKPIANFTDVLSYLQNGSFSFTKAQLETIYGGTIPDGSHTLNLVATDQYGNQSSVYPYIFTLDTTISTPSLQLVASSDTGASNSDKITKNNTPTITGTGDIGATIKLTDGNAIVGQTTVGTDGKWQVATSQLTNGTHSLTATATDLAGNISTASAPLSLVVDTLAPQLTLTTPLDTNPLKNNAKLSGTINGTGSNLASINYRWDNSTTPIAINPNVTGGFDQGLDFAGISNGTHQIAIVATDVAGNIATTNYNVTVAIDKTAPVITAKLAADTGSSNSDKITFNPAISGTISDANQIAGFKASFDGINYVNILSQKQADGSFTLTKTQLETVAGSSLVDGSYMLHLIATDEFGNASQNYDLAFTLDTTITTPSNLQLAVGSDTGASNNDKITKTDTPTISGTGDIGATIKLSDGNVVVGQTTVGVDGKWQIVSSQLTNGTHSLIATATDLAGNISDTSAPLDLVIDTLLPQLTLTTPIDSNPLQNNAKLLGSIDATGSNLTSVSYQWDNHGNPIFINTNATGNFDQLLDFTGINNGAHILSVTAIDVAGNLTIASYNVNVANNLNAPVIALKLANDTGSSNNDGITNDAKIGGNVTTVGLLTGFKVSLDGTNYTDIIASVQPDGQFTLSLQQLEIIAGRQLTDGNYTLKAIATDSLGNISAQSTNLSFTLDTTNPLLSLITPSSTGTYSTTVPFRGTGSDNLQLIGGGYQIDGKPAVAYNVSPQGTIDLNLADSDLAAGSHHIDVRLTDIAGNTTTKSLDFTTSNNFIISPAQNPGWGMNAGNALTLAEGQSLITQTSIPVTLGSTSGQRLVEFDVKAIFDLSDTTTVSADRLAVYLVDPNDRSRTLLDGGKPGTALFTLIGERAEFAKGIVRYDGTHVTIDLSKVPNAPTTGELVFQLLNNDRDTGSTVKIDNIATRLNPTGKPGTLLDFSTPHATIGGAIDLSGYTATTNAKLLLTNVRFNSVTGKYTADIQVQNIGNTPLPRQLALLFPDLPAGVTIDSPSGSNATGSPYLNLKNAIVAGGLDSNEISKAIEVTFSDLSQVQFGLNPVFLAGAADVPLTFNNLGTLTVRPGERLALPLIANDPNGDPIVLSIESSDNLPTGKLTAERLLNFTPRPDQVGTYTFTLVAKQGNLVTKQNVTLNVVPDPIQTTRISGVIQGTDTAPIAGLTVNVGGVLATTLADGSFTLELPVNNTATTLTVGGNGYSPITSQFTALLGHDLYSGTNNQLERPISLLGIDPNSGTTVTPTLAQTITTAVIPLAAITIAANTATDDSGNPYTGKLNLLEVSLKDAPIGFPDLLNPDLLVMLQGNATFTAPVTITLPNRAGYTPGTKLDLWALSPTTGAFEKVGQGQVSTDGQTVTTISGGIKNSTWFCFAPTAIDPVPQADNPYNAQPTVTSYQASTPINSSASLQSGVVMETQELLSYRSLGETRTVALHYDSLHADPREIINFSYNNYKADGNTNTLVAKLTIRLDNFKIEIPTKEWNLPTNNQQLITAGIQVDLSEQKTGVYQYDLEIGVQKANGQILYGSSSVIQGQLIHVNTTKSQFGSGWGLVGLQELVINKDNSILWVDGDGSRAVFVPGMTVNGITSYSASLGEFSKLEKLSDGTYRRILKDQTVSLFDASGKLQTITDRNQNATQYKYNGNLLSEIIDPQGLKTTFSNGTVTSPDGRITSLQLTGGNLTSIIYPDDTHSDWSYDNFHRIRQVKDQNGNVGTDDYDELGRVKSATRKDGSEVNIKPATVLGVVLETSTGKATVNAVPEPTSTQVDGEGNIITKTLDQFGQTIEVSDAIGKQSTTVRDRNGNITKAIDGEGNITSYTYDDRNNLTGITYGDLGNAPVTSVPPFNDALTPIKSFNLFTRFAVGDMNGDGIDDLVSSNLYGSSVSIFTGNSNGTFATVPYLLGFASSYWESTAFTTKIAIADINGDGIKDVVATVQGNQRFSPFGTRSTYIPIVTNIVVALGGGAQGSNVYRLHDYIVNDTYIPNSFSISDLVCGDFNGDGKEDIVVVGNSSSTDPNFRVLLTNSSNNSLSRVSTRVEGLGDNIRLAVGDFNGDGKQDLAASSTFSTQLGTATFPSILNGNGNGTFSAPLEQLPILGSNSLPSVGDLNGDGNLDIVVAAGGNLGVYLGQGGGNFQFVDYGASGALFTRLGDINGDGKLDIVTGDNTQHLRVLTGKSDGTFATSTNFYNISPNPRGFYLGNFNGDGKLDALIIDSNNQVFAKFNQFIPDSPVVNTQKKFTYDSKFNQLTSVTDELGRQTIYEIDASNGDRLSETRIVGALGGDDDLITRYTYNSHGQISTMTDAKSNLTTFAYNNPLGQLSSILNAAGATTSYLYDNAGNRTAIIDANQHRTDYVFDNMNRLKETIGERANLAANPRSKYDYYNNGQIKSVTDPNGNITRYEYDELDRLTKTVDGEGNISTNHYDKAGNIDYTIDGRGNKTKYEYDGRKRLIKVINPDLTYRTMTYDLANNLKTVTDENNNTTTNKYDSRNRLVEQIDALGKSTFYTYDDASQLKEVKDARGKVNKYAYDDLGRKTTTTAPIDSTTTAVTKVEYDKNSNVTATIDAENRRNEYAYDVLNRRIGVKDADNKTTISGYDKVGNITTVTDANNNQTRYVYDELNRQVQTIDALNGETLTAYDLAGNVKAVTSVNGNITSYNYDKNNRQIQVADARGVIQTTAYNEVGRVKTTTDAIGLQTQYTYDNRNRLTHFIDQFGADSETKYDGVSNVTATSDAEGHAIGYKYNANNWRTEVIKTVTTGQTFSEFTSYDNVGNITSTKNGEGFTNTYEYDDLNRLVKVIDPLNYATTTSYDKVGNVLSATDALGRITKYTYDNLNRQKTVTAAFGTVDATTNSYTYDNVGNLRLATNGRGNTSEYIYDKLNRQTQTKDPANNTTQVEYFDTPGLVASLLLASNLFLDASKIGEIVKTTDALNSYTLDIYDRFGRSIETYDESGKRTSKQSYYADDRLQSVTDIFGKTTSYQYRDNLRQTVTTDPFNGVTTNTYDKVGNLKTTQDSLGRTTSYNYDNLNRQTTIVDAEGGITSYTYDNNDRTKTIKDAANNTTSYTYDGDGRLTVEQSVLGTRTYGYDAVDNQITATDRNGRTTNYAYDNLDRVKSELWVGNGQQFTYTYDKNSNLLSANDGNMRYDYSYDSRDWLTQLARTGNNSPIVTFGYDYDAIGNIITATETVNGTTTATTTYAYNDPRHLNTEITQTGTNLAAKRVQFSYDQFGLTTGIERYFNNQLAVSTTHTYDSFGRLTGIEQRNSSAVISSSTYDLDIQSRLAGETKDGANRQFDYDDTDQVTSVTGSNSEAYTYDKNGNRTNAGYVTSTGNRLLSDGTYNYDYDAEGNRTKRTKIADNLSDEYTWDYRNRLTSVVSKDGNNVVTQTVGYEYDTDDQRTKKTVNGTVENYYLDRNQIAFVTDGSGTQTFHYLYGQNVDSVLAQDSPTGMVWALADRLGSIDTLTDGSGNVVDKRTFDSFGRVLSETNPLVKFRYGYTGRETDGETGYYYYRARYYDAANGRFISVDPAGFGAGDTNLYRYVGNSSTGFTDPSGEWSLPSWDDLQRGASDFYNGITTTAQNSLEYYAGLAVRGQNEGGFVGGVKQVVGTGGGLLSSLATRDNIGATATVLTGGAGAVRFLGAKVIGSAAVATGVGIVGDLYHPNLVQAPVGKNDRAELPPGYELERAALEFGLGFGIGSGPRLAQGLDNLLTTGGRKLGNLLDGVPVLVDGFENIGRNPTSLGELFKPGLQTGGAAVNNAGQLFQPYFASTTSGGTEGGISGRFDQLATGLPKADLRASIRDGNLDSITKEQQDAILKKLLKGKVDEASVKIVNANGNVRLVLERAGRVSGFQRLTLEIDPSGNTVRMVQTAFDDSSKLVQQKPGISKNNLFDIKK